MRSALVLLVLSALASPAYGQSFGYARLGYGAGFSNDVQGAPAIGFGIRSEFDSIALDGSFLNYVIGNPYSSEQVVAGSLLRLQVLRFLNSAADKSVYVGGGLSWGTVSLGRGPAAGEVLTSWHGSGLQGEVTIGYELARNSPVRIFVQTDVGLPFFNAVSQTYALGRSSGTDRRYIPSAAVSVGIGWQRRGP